MRRAFLVVVLPLAACAGAVDVSQTAWQATLAAGPGGISGSAAAVSVAGRTHASIAIERAVPGQQYGWRIQHGDCQAQGTLVGTAATYPTLTAADDGTAGADTYLSQVLSTGPYAARVAALQAGGGETPAACGALEQVP